MRRIISTLSTGFSALQEFDYGSFDTVFVDEDGETQRHGRSSDSDAVEAMERVVSDGLRRLTAADVPKLRFCHICECRPRLSASPSQYRHPM